MMLSGDSGAGESISTPRSASKRLFTLNGSSSKRNLFSSPRRPNRHAETSGEDSDLGPMSPLALTDRSESSRESSPGRRYSSPFHTPDKSLVDLEFQTWDRLRPSSSKKKSFVSHSPFPALKSLTRAARSSPKRRIRENSPTAMFMTPRRKNFNVVVGTPEREIASLFDDDVVPETPQKDSDDNADSERIEETPRKDDERRERDLITPLGSVLKQIVVPRINRRKSVCPFDNEETSSPERKENILKRRANENLVASIVKIPKIEDSSVPKARASLFRENNATLLTPEITVSAKSFYRSSEKRGRSVGPDFRDIEPTKKRHSLPSSMSNHSYHKRPAKRMKRGEMNAGVRHGIKKPKTKKHVSRVDAHKNNADKISPEKIENSPKNVTNDKSDQQFVDSRSKTATKFQSDEIAKRTTDSASKTVGNSVFRKIEKLPSPISDPNKRFFKTNRTMQSNHLATVTVNNKIKLNVHDGKIALNAKNCRVGKNSGRKRAKLEDISFDATDLTVDEPGFDTSSVGRNVDGILKVLENDWAEDDYDTMETLTVSSPRKTVAAATRDNSSILMSPGSVLSDMTSSMNIEDLGGGRMAGKDMENRSTAGTSEEISTVDKKLFPLFAKGYSSSIAEETFGTKSPRGTKRSWQTSTKGGCGGAENQYQIDAGQKRFGASVCNECGIVYQLGDPEDENAHLNYHNSYRILRFNGWKKERVIMTDPMTNSRIIAIEPNDSKLCWKKVEEVLAVVDRDLGLADMELMSYLDKKIYFYVRNKTILGVMIAENIKTAHRMIPELMDLDCCSDEETPAKCGVNVIWTAMSHRRQHIATKLLDTVRATYFFGYIMSMDDIAFSMPTPSGKIFAEKYTKTRSFKVYT